MRSISNILPEAGLVRIQQLIGNRKATPPIPPILPFSKSTLYEMVKAGTFPKPVRLGARMSAWRVEDIRSFLDNLGA